MQKDNQPEIEEQKNSSPENPKTGEDGYEIAKNSLRRKQKERKLRKKRKRQNNFKAFLRFVVFWLLVLCLYKFLTLSGWFLPKDFLNNKHKRVEILNNKIVPTNIIYDHLSDVNFPNLPIYLVGVGKIKHEIFKIPVIKRIYVRRFAFPARIKIIVQEREPVVILKTELKNRPAAFYTFDNVLITNQNYMNIKNDKSILVILVKSPISPEFWNKKKFEYMQKIANSVENYSAEKVEYIDYRKTNDVYVKIKSSNIRLGALDSTVFERIKRIYTILPQITNLKGKIRYIDLSWDKVNYIKLKQ